MVGAECPGIPPPIGMDSSTTRCETVSDGSAINSTHMARRMWESTHTHMLNCSGSPSLIACESCPVRSGASSLASCGATPPKAAPVPGQAMLVKVCMFFRNTSSDFHFTSRGTLGQYNLENWCFQSRIPVGQAISSARGVHSTPFRRTAIRAGCEHPQTASSSNMRR
jgi:hypothetical protein